MSIKHSFCRICAGKCGLVVEVDDAKSRIQSIRGDHDHPMTQGYACIKGLQAGEMHHSPQRLLKPLERQPDGCFKEVAMDVALDRIAARLKQIVARDGADAMATFRGTQHYANTSAFHMLSSFIKATGTRSRFSTMTIDQSAKWVADHRLGVWGAGRQAFEGADVWMFIGYNPLVSVQCINGFPALNPLKRIKAAKKRGMKIIVIDPRESETAKFADIYLQPKPGQDPVLLAGLLRIILQNEWHDNAFCHRYVDGVDALLAALTPFAPEFVSECTGISAEQLQQTAELFAVASTRGIAVGGTGPDMAPYSNLAEHLIEALNVVCGRFMREGELVANPGAMSPRRAVRAEVIAPHRDWEEGYKSRVRNLGMINGEKMSGALADEILTPGDGQIKALLVAGGNPLNALPDRRKAFVAMQALELLVCIDPYLSETAQLADYILPPTMMFERPDLPLLFEKTAYPRPFVQYSDALIEPPEGADVAEDWYIFWALAQRLNLPLKFAGVELDMSTQPTTEDLLAILVRNAQVPLAQMKAHPSGAVVDLEPLVVSGPRPDREGNRFCLAPEDVLAELQLVYAGSSWQVNTDDYPLLLTVRRSRTVLNSSYRQMTFTQKRMPENPLWMHPDDIATGALVAGERVSIVSTFGSITGLLQEDKTMRVGTVSMSHGWGGSGGYREGSEEDQVGAAINNLIPDNQHCENINAMPWFSAVPVRVEPL